MPVSAVVGRIEVVSPVVAIESADPHLVGPPGGLGPRPGDDARPSKPMPVPPSHGIWMYLEPSRGCRMV